MTLKWELLLTEEAEKRLSKLNRSTAQHIVQKIKDKLLSVEDPTIFAKPLRHGMLGFWRLCVEDYRVIFMVHQDKRMVMVTHIGHRRSVYEG